MLPGVRWLAVLALGGCASSVPLLPLEAAAPITRTPTSPLEMMTRSTGVPDPVRVSQHNPTRWPPLARYSGLEVSMGHAVGTALVPWAEAHQGGIGWKLLVELTEAKAKQEDERIVVTVGARATLKTRSGSYLAQTQVHCRQAALVAPTEAAPVFYACLNDLGRELHGWLVSVQP